MRSVLSLRTAFYKAGGMVVQSRGSETRGTRTGSRLCQEAAGTLGPLSSLQEGGLESALWVQPNGALRAKKTSSAAKWRWGGAAGTESSV